MRGLFVGSMRRAGALLGTWLALFPTLSAQVELLSVVGDAKDAGLGEALENCGDLDGDGYDELGVKRRQEWFVVSADAWLVYSTADMTVRYVFFGADSDSQSLTLSQVGDLDADGVPDLALGMPYFDVGGLDNAGLIRVVSGATGLPFLEYAGPSAYSRIGLPNPVDLGDQNSDGTSDLMVVSLGWGGLPGSVRLLSGSDAAVLAAYTPPAPEDTYTRRPEGLPDMDGDGRMEGAFIMKGPSTWYTMRVWSPMSGQLLWNIGQFGPNDPFLRRVGDSDGDGVADLALGVETGAQVLVYNLLTKNLIGTITGSVGFGTWISSPADVDLDGTLDFAVGAPEFPSGEGRVEVVSGSNFAPIYSVDGLNPGDFAHICELVSDLIGDGRAELVVGAPDYDQSASMTNTGRISIHAKQGACGSALPYGAVCPAGGQAPVLAATGCIGSPADITLHWSNVQAGSLGLFVFGTQKASVPVEDCVLQVSPLVATFPWIVPAASGSFSVLAPIGLGNSTVTLQLFLLDPGGAPGVAATNGLELSFP